MPAAQHRRTNHRTAAAAVTTAVAAAIAVSAPAAHADHYPFIGNTLSNVADSAAGNITSVLGLIEPGAGVVNSLGGGVITATPTPGHPTVGLAGPLDLSAVFTPIGSKSVLTGTDPSGPWTDTTTDVGSTTTVTGPGGTSVSFSSVLHGYDISVNMTSISAPTGLKAQLPGPLGTLDTTVTPFTAIGDQRVDAALDASTTYTVPGLGKADATLSAPHGMVEPEHGFDFRPPTAGATVSPESGGTYGVRVDGGRIAYSKDDGLEVRGPSVRVDTGDKFTEIGTGTVGTESGYSPDVHINQDN